MNFFMQSISSLPILKLRNDIKVKKNFIYES